MLVVVWVAFSISNIREVRSLWNKQRHALVHYYKFATKVVGFEKKVHWLLATIQTMGLKH